MAQGDPILNIPDDDDPEPEIQEEWWSIFVNYISVRMLIIFLLFHIKLDGWRIDDLTEATRKMTVNVDNLVNCVSVSSGRNNPGPSQPYPSMPPRYPPSNQPPMLSSGPSAMQLLQYESAAPYASE